MSGRCQARRSTNLERFISLRSNGDRGIIVNFDNLSRRVRYKTELSTTATISPDEGLLNRGDLPLDRLRQTTEVQFTGLPPRNGSQARETRWTYSPNDKCKASYWPAAFLSSPTLTPGTWQAAEVSSESGKTTHLRRRHLIFSAGTLTSSFKIRLGSPLLALELTPYSGTHMEGPRHIEHAIPPRALACGGGHPHSLSSEWTQVDLGIEAKVYISEPRSRKHGNRVDWCWPTSLHAE